MLFLFGEIHQQMILDLFSEELLIDSLKWVCDSGMK